MIEKKYILVEINRSRCYKKGGCSIEDIPGCYECEKRAFTIDDEAVRLARNVIKDCEKCFFRKWVSVKMKADCPDNTYYCREACSKYLQYKFARALVAIADAAGGGE
jgi:hypothetical protein